MTSGAESAEEGEAVQEARTQPIVISAAAPALDVSYPDASAEMTLSIGAAETQDVASIVPVEPLTPSVEPLGDVAEVSIDDFAPDPTIDGNSILELERQARAADEPVSRFLAVFDVLADRFRDAGLARSFVDLSIDESVEAATSRSELRNLLFSLANEAGLPGAERVSGASLVIANGMAVGAANGDLDAIDRGKELAAALTVSERPAVRIGNASSAFAMELDHDPFELDYAYDAAPAMSETSYDLRSFDESTDFDLGLT